MEGRIDRTVYPVSAFGRPGNSAGQSDGDRETRGRDPETGEACETDRPSDRIGGRAKANTTAGTVRRCAREHQGACTAPRKPLSNRFPG
ncbi:hypothetical protein K0M31_010207, partial [Melipona bicolor]